MAQEAPERAEVPEQIANRLRHAGARLESLAMPTPPAQQLREERTRTTLSKCEMLVGSDDAGLLRVTLDDVDLSDEVESLLRFWMLAVLEYLATRVSKTAGASALAGLRDRVVAGVSVDDEASLRIAEHSLWGLAASVRGVAVAAHAA